MFRYPLGIENVSSRDLWIQDATGERVAVATKKVGSLGDPGGTIRVYRCEAGRPVGEIFEVEARVSGEAGEPREPPGVENIPDERLSAEVLKRRYDVPGVPRAGSYPLDHAVYEPDGRSLGSLGVRSHWQGVWEIADPSGEVIGRVLRERMFFRDCEVKLRGQNAMRLQRRGLLFGRMELTKSERVAISAEQEKLLLAGVIFVLLEGSSGGG